MAKLDTCESTLRRTGAVAMLVTLLSILYGVQRGLRRPRGLTTGRAATILRGQSYVLIGIPYFALCAWLWRPIRAGLSPPARIAGLVLGAPVYLLGLALVLWARLTLGEMYNVSSGFGVQLYAQHRLITHGPYALGRHPIYLGVTLAALGGLALYRTWTLVLLLINALIVLAVRGWREEQALAAEFGAEWIEYCGRVPFVMRFPV